MERANSIQIVNTCHALARSGVRLHLVVRRTGWRSTAQCLAFYGLTPHPNLIVHRLPVLNTHWSYPLWNYSFALGALSWILSRRVLAGADLVYVRDLGLARILLAHRRVFGLPVLYESHEISHLIYRSLHTHLADVPRLDDRVVARIEANERFVYRGADDVIAITAALAELVETTFNPPRPVTVVPDGVRLGTQQERVLSQTIYYIGQLYPWKGVDVLVRAMAHLPGRELVVVGGLPYESDTDRLKKLAGDLGVAGRVDFKGFVPPSEVATHLARAAVVVLPLPDNLMARSFTSPLKLFEYLACGVPIVASDLPSIREILEHERNALLVEPENPQALAGAIERLLSDETPSQRLSRQARLDVRTYTWEKRADLIRRKATEVLRRQGGSTH